MFQMLLLVKRLAASQCGVEARCYDQNHFVAVMQMPVQNGASGGGRIGCFCWVMS